MTNYAALIGIDWSDKKHDICIVDSASGKREASAPATLAASYRGVGLRTAEYHSRYMNTAAT